jgi:hypothetical protein
MAVYVHKPADMPAMTSTLYPHDRQLTVEAPRARTKNRPDSETMRDRQWFGMKASPLDQDTKYTLALVANSNLPLLRPSPVTLPLLSALAHAAGALLV